jgi:hypothetical protein
MTNGVEREVMVDDEYIRRSLMEPNADVVVASSRRCLPWAASWTKRISS